MPDEILWKDAGRGLEIRRSDEPSVAVIALLEETVWGSRDTRYRILGIAAKLERLRDPSFFVLSERDRVLSVFVLDHCRKRIAGSLRDGFHFVMAATDTARQNEGLAGLLIDRVRAYCEAYLDNGGFGFAYVEETTEFSLRLSDRIGHKIEAEIPLLLFSRLFPRRHSEAGRAGAADLISVREHLERLYDGHELTDFDSSVEAENCLIYRRNGEITAAVQAELLTWSVVSLPGAMGRFLLGVYSRLPLANRFLDLRDLRLLRFGNIYVAEGAEDDLYALLETCLHQQRSKIGLIMLDRRSPVLERLRGTGDFGLLSNALSGSAKLRLDTVALEQAEIEGLCDGPLYISAADVF